MHAIKPPVLTFILFIVAAVPLWVNLVIGSLRRRSRDVKREKPACLGGRARVESREVTCRGGRVQLSDPFGKPGGQMCFRIRLPKRRAACSLLVRRHPVGSREPRAFRSMRAEQSRTFRWTEKDQITLRQFKSVFGANSSASEVTKETPFRNGGDRFASLSRHVPGCLMSRGGSVPRRLPLVHLCHIRTSDGRAVATLVPHTFPSDLTERRGVASDLAAGRTPTFPAAARPPRPPAAPRSARRPSAAELSPPVFLLQLRACRVSS